MQELGAQVLNNLEKLGLRVPDELHNLGNDIELWMTYLSQAQPWLQDDEVYLNLATVRQIRKQIKEIIDIRTASAAQPPDWLKCLIRSWHDQRANVLTLNYPVCYLNSTPEWSRLKAAILRFTRVLSDKNVFT